MTCLTPPLPRTHSAMRASVLLLATMLVACGDSGNEPDDPDHLMLGTFRMVGPRLALHMPGTPCEIWLVDSRITTDNDGVVVRRDSIETDAAYGVSTSGTAAVVRVSVNSPPERVELTQAGQIEFTCDAPDYSAGTHLDIGYLQGDTLLLAVQHRIPGVLTPRTYGLRYER